MKKNIFLILSIFICCEIKSSEVRFTASGISYLIDNLKDPYKFRNDVSQFNDPDLSNIKKRKILFEETHNLMNFIKSYKGSKIDYVEAEIGLVLYLELFLSNKSRKRISVPKEILYHNWFSVYESEDYKKNK